MSIPCKMRPVGLESLPLGYTRLDFLKSPYDVIQESSARFDLGMFTYSIENGDTLRIQTKHRVTSIPTEMNGYAGKEGFSNNEQVFQVAIAGHTRAHSSTSAAENVTPIENYALMYDGAIGNSRGWDRALFIPGLKLDLDWHVLDAFMSKETLSFSIDSDKVSAVPWLYPSDTTQMLTCFGTGENTNGATWPFLGQKQWFKFWLNGELQRSLVPALSPAGTPCMFDLVSKTPFYNAGIGTFIAGLTTKQALSLANLPTPTAINTLTVSLPWDAQWDVGVQKALSRAAARGWIITVQYRDPEVATENIPVSFLEIPAIGGTAQYNAYINLGAYEIDLRAGDAIEIQTEHIVPFTPTWTSWGPSEGFTQNGGCFDLRLVGTARVEMGGAKPEVPIYNFGLDFDSIENNANTIVRIADAEWSPIWHKFRLTRTATECVFEMDGKQSRFAVAHFSMLSPGVLTCFGNYTNNQSLPGRKKYFRFYKNGELLSNLIPALSPSGAPCMYDSVSKQNFYNSGTGAFIAGFDTAEQARKLAYLPDVTAETDATKKSLTVSMPLELAFDASVKSALSIATARGWTITVQHLESEVATANLEADFLESTGTQLINTELVVESDFHAELTGLWKKKDNPQGYVYFLGTMARVDRAAAEQYRLLVVLDSENSGFAVDMGSGWWMYESHNQDITEIEVCIPALYGDSAELVVDGATLTPFNTEGGNSPTDLRSPLVLGGYSHNGAMSTSGNVIGRLEAAAISCTTSNGAKTMNLVPRLDPSGAPCMYDTVSGQNFYNQGSGSFTVGFDTTEKAAISLSKLPVTTNGKLTVSLPAEAKDASTLVPAAIDIAKSRGWTIIEQLREN